jgi:F420-0:gamma-glutamyl ligase
MSEATAYQANPGKNLSRSVDGVEYLRIPIKTHLITNADDMGEVVLKYAGEHMQPGDILFVSEKAVACTQNRAIPMEEIKPRKLAVILSNHVTKTPAGIGLGIPETMEMALRECGTLRILFAAFCSIIGKLLGKKGWFYLVAGPKARGIDGPTEGTIPPYDHYVVLTPDQPQATAKKLAQTLGHPVAIVDVNDLGANILGFSEKEPAKQLLAEILGDNPLGQSEECTPMGVIRAVQASDEPVQEQTPDQAAQEQVPEQSPAEQEQEDNDARR